MCVCVCFLSGSVSPKGYLKKNQAAATGKMDGNQLPSSEAPGFLDMIPKSLFLGKSTKFEVKKKKHQIRQGAKAAPGLSQVSGFFGIFLVGE